MKNLHGKRLVGLTVLFFGCLCYLVCGDFFWYHYFHPSFWVYLVITGISVFIPCVLGGYVLSRILFPLQTLPQHIPQLSDPNIKTIQHVFEETMTAQQHSDSQRHHETQKIRFILEAQQIGLWEVNCQTQTVFWSPEMYPLFGVTQDTYTPYFRGWLLLLPEEDRAAILSQVTHAVAAQIPYLEYTIPRMIQKRKHWIKKYCHYTYHPDGSLHTGYGICQDITYQYYEQTYKKQLESHFTYLFTTDLSLAHQVEILSGFVGRHPTMLALYRNLVEVSNTSTPVLLTGETGTGKELLARTLHTMSSRARLPFIPINCSAIPRDLFESEFFGHQKGAFTGAIQNHIGLLATEGTVFLDELEALSLRDQAKLLRAVEYGYRPVGNIQEHPITCRIVAATNIHPVNLIAQNHLREDFFFRLAGVILEIPPLRNRREDIPLLISRFWSSLGQHEDIPESLMRTWMQATWPGNVRELKHAVEQYAIFHHWPINEPVQHTYLANLVAEYEQKVINSTVLACQGNRSEAAKVLGISERTLYRKLKV